MRRNAAEPRRAPGGQVSSRRALQLSVQRLVLAPPPSSSVFPALCPGLGASAEGAPQPPAALPSLLAPMTPAAAMKPTCVCCGGAMTWTEWRACAAMLPLGGGKFYGRCEPCQAIDESFKQTLHGVPP